MSVWRAPACRTPSRRLATPLGLLVAAVQSALFAAPSVIVDLVDASQALRIDASNSTDQPGVDVAACDLDRDGLLDLVIGDWRANGVNDLRTDCGEASLTLGSRRAWQASTTIGQLRSTRIVGQDACDRLSLRLDCGDVDSDGYADLVLGAYSADGRFNALSSAGQAHVVTGRSLFPAVIDLVMSRGR